MTDAPAAIPPPPPAAAESSSAPAARGPRAQQIVSINEEGTKFQLNEQLLEEIFAKVPEDMKVAIISVVGAFRTGKSFALDLFLRYLRFSDGDMRRQWTESDQEDPAQSWKQWAMAGCEGNSELQLEGNTNFGPTEVASKGFSWRAGRKRNTTGIWMWEEPFLRQAQHGETIAVFLIDTQGMFDSETSQMLTASIFGLSTLLSSYQIYNVDKRVQEDNLQHLALFTEYGRMALFGKSDQNADRKLSTTPPVLQSQASHQSLGRSESTTSAKEEEVQQDAAGDDPDATKDTDQDGTDFPRPFQRLDFLVRDWQDFSKTQSLKDKKADMEIYMQELLASRKQKDLADTREQINSCFEKVGCFLLPHPGHEVAERDYDGSVEAIDPRFLELLTCFLDDLFAPENLFPKKIHGLSVTSRELATYIKSYASLFREASIFPEAKTLLEATAEANNVNNRDKALSKYKKEMEILVGAKCRYVGLQTLEYHHQLCCQGAMVVFDEGAKMGRHAEIIRFRGQLADMIESEKQRFFEINAERDPYKNLELYLVPGVFALGLLVFRVIQDLFCYEHIGYDVPLYDCKEVSHTLKHLYTALIVFMLLIALSTGQEMFRRVRTVINVVQSAMNAASHPGKEKED